MSLFPELVNSESVLRKITALHLEVSCIIYRQGGVPSHNQYYYALELAEEAMELAIGAQLNEVAIDECEAFQRYCYNLLKLSYAKTDDYERHVYTKSTSRASSRDRRGGRVYEVDQGEHLLEALQAVHIGALLDNPESVERSRKIRWVDETGNKPIRSVHI